MGAGVQALSEDCEVVMKIEVKSVRIKIGAHEHDLTLDEVRELRAKLDDVIGRQPIVLGPIVAPQVYPVYPMNPWPGSVPVTWPVITFSNNGDQIS